MRFRFLPYPPGGGARGGGEDSIDSSQGAVDISLQDTESSDIKRENIVTVKAFVCRGRTLLMIRHENGRWDLPGGRMNIPEPIADTLRREVREELGVEIASADFDHPWVWCWEKQSTSRPLIQNIVGIGYLCELASDDFRPSPPEHIAHTWATAADLRTLNMHDGHRAGYLRWMELHGIA